MEKRNALLLAKLNSAWNGSSSSKVTLQDVVDVLERKIKRGREVGSSKRVAEMAQILFGPILCDWLPQFSERQKHELFDSFLLPQVAAGNNGETDDAAAIGKD